MQILRSCGSSCFGADLSTHVTCATRSTDWLASPANISVICCCRSSSETRAFPFEACRDTSSTHPCFCSICITGSLYTVPSLMDASVVEGVMSNFVLPMSKPSMLLIANWTRRLKRLWKSMYSRTVARLCSGSFSISATNLAMYAGFIFSFPSLPKNLCFMASTSAGVSSALAIPPRHVLRLLTSSPAAWPRWALRQDRHAS
mmetsp:Transcript_10483/g.29651  ORF Transcript_10483/g.29651 Transcript_10483/m.29651 type:complete len:202 (-) Transcript_10483:200-805(-)